MKLIDAERLKIDLQELRIKLEQESVYGSKRASTIRMIENMISNEPLIEPESLRPAAQIVWKERQKIYVKYDQIPVSEYHRGNKLAFTRRTIKKVEHIPCCSRCGKELKGIVSFCPWCGAIIIDKSWENLIQRAKNGEYEIR